MLNRYITLVRAVRLFSTFWSCACFVSILRSQVFTTRTDPKPSNGFVYTILSLHLLTRRFQALRT